MAPEPALQAGVILRAAEKVTHELPEYRAAPEELHHARGHRGAQERTAIEAAHNARGKFELRRKRGLHARWIFFWAAFRKRPPKQFAGAHGVEKAFAREGVHPRRRVANHRPILAHNSAFRKGAFARRWQNVTVELRSLGRDILFLYKTLQMRTQLRARVRRHAAADAHR